MEVLGLDVGGANLKAAHSNGVVRSQPFPLWKRPAALPEALRALLEGMPAHDLLAVTMTGELCDCYESKRQGVTAILDGVVAAADGTPIRVWSTDGQLVDIETARATPLQVAAANWLALATFAGRYAPAGPALLIDIGSTTTDIIPLMDGVPIPRGRTDPERLRSQELVYTGVRRTPLCALLGPTVAAEWFATTLDVYLLLGCLPENPTDCDTADGRPATRAAAHARLARMLGADLETCTAEERHALALRAAAYQEEVIGLGVRCVATRPPATVIVSGAGEFLARRILEKQKPCLTARLVSLAEELSPALSQAAAARALAALVGERKADGGWRGK